MPDILCEWGMAGLLALHERVAALEELWPDGGLRPAVEDLLGAGAIIGHLGGEASPEAEVARDAWQAAGHRLGGMIRLCTSGQELVPRGYSGDVDLAVEEDASATAPLLRDGAYRAA